MNGFNNDFQEFHEEISVDSLDKAFLINLNTKNYK